jgi:hypothetical protein
MERIITNLLSNEPMFGITINILESQSLVVIIQKLHSYIYIQQNHVELP